MPRSKRRPEGQWPAWIDDVLAYPPIAELEPEWQAGIADAIVRVLDIRSGARDSVSRCERHGMILVLGCTACQLEKQRRPWWRFW